MWFILGDIATDVAAIRADVASLKTTLTQVRTYTLSLDGTVSQFFDPLQLLAYVPVVAFFAGAVYVLVLYWFMLTRIRREWVK